MGQKGDIMSDLSTLGVTLHYGVETKAGSKPTTFTWLKRCNAIDGISLDTDQIDVSALEDYITQYTAGRQDTGGSWTVTFNMNTDVITAIKKLFSDAKTAKANGFSIWFEIVFPGLSDAFFVIADPGTNIPLPDISQASPATLPISMVVKEYKGLDTKVVSDASLQALDDAKAVADAFNAPLS